MSNAEAHIHTERPSRYLVQFCQHVSSIYSTGGPTGRHQRRRHLTDDPQHASGPPPRVEWSRTEGTISSGASTITLQASPGALILRIEAADEESLQRARDLVTDLLGRFARREHLTITWHQAPAPT